MAVFALIDRSISSQVPAGVHPLEKLGDLMPLLASRDGSADPRRANQR